SGLLEAVRAPVDRRRRLRDRAGGLLVLERHAVREAVELDDLLDGELAAVREADLDLEGIPAVDRGGARDRGRELALDARGEPALEQLVADRRQARRRRRHDLD